MAVPVGSGNSDALIPESLASWSRAFASPEFFREVRTRVDPGRLGAGVLAVVRWSAGRQEAIGNSDPSTGRDVG